MGLGTSRNRFVSILTQLLLQRGKAESSILIAMEDPNLLAVLTAAVA